MKINHITRVQDNGLVIPVTIVSHRDLLGRPMASSFHGWMSEEDVKFTLKRLREIDSQQEKFNG
ncbi:hypothetical protein Ab1vBOLIVR2_gp30 [Agrobacterium phage OLIVR2]|uniref:Uncharacterized protein n=1 Tax=Agrobacterium phage OLIVR1 TaxID=2723769 RepID=A0A858MXF2_9CAUD|nr:hypothetical protein [Xanthomonas campestris]YP_010107064.1 hypothetical protein KNU98_gp079 [Agrobacterium phage OLIVR1]QIW87333.1 hypothetical protein Ab1vBOLIVR2_gp30 [Agrobacterium phage OLIVR2]QIW87440.1 hypothetical protein Ab1vBOLIVR3_gp30 [Agrobacterium phage OLIVR3]MCF8861624.1 hypothetical protein [Xanthomonas campestris pv. campestris]QIW87225.1 hypothetical protein Ab1vBOLIVR1_gp30 [Agrobacterium phage OLIVR1]